MMISAIHSITESMALGALAREPQPKWYAIYTCPRHEKRVAEHLRDRNICYFLPLYRSIRRWKDRNKELHLALFPGYVFVNVLPRERLPVLQVSGVVRFVSFNGQPAELPDSEMEVLKRGINSGSRVEPHPYLTVGRRVRIRNGPFANAHGILLRRKDKFRVILSLDLITRSVSVEVDEGDVEASYGASSDQTLMCKAEVGRSNQDCTEIVAAV